MRAVVQRVAEAEVAVDGTTVGRIGPGLLVLVAIETGDDAEAVSFMARKLVSLRVFGDEAGKMNLSVLDVGGELLLISQFTLLGDCRKGARPSYTRSAPPADAERWYRELAAEIGKAGIPVATGQFQAHMSVSLVNDGPVTLIIDSRKAFY